jgi:carboxyl-terminal processing protease
VGIVRIKFFSSATADDVREKVASLLKGGGGSSGKSSGSGVSAIVLDLRSNPGGLLQGGADTARLFLPKGSAIVSVRDNKGTEDKQRVDRDLVERAQEDGGPGADGSFARV